jgi:hypothetical protein
MIDNESAWDKLLQIKTTGRDDQNSRIFCKDDVVLDYGCGKGLVVFFYPIKQRQNLR